MKKIQRITPSSIRIVRRYSDNIAPTTVPFAAAPKFSFGGGNRQFSFGGGNRQFSFGGGNRQFAI